MRLVHEPEQARDLAQETFVACVHLASIDLIPRDVSVLGCFESGGVNLGLDWLRSTKSDPPSTASIDRTDAHGQATFEVADPDPRIRAELAQEVQFVLGLMPVSYRAILVLRDLEGFSSSEVAAIVGRREATIRWRLAKAREKFREIWHCCQDECVGRPRMINQVMGTTMRNPSCDWTRARLPLWGGDHDHPTVRNGDGDDLGPEDRRSDPGNI